MSRYTIYQQHPPMKSKQKGPDGENLYDPVLVRVGQLEADSDKDAIALAKGLSEFCNKSRSATLMAFPIVELETRAKREAREAATEALDEMQDDIQ